MVKAAVFEFLVVSIDGHEMYVVHDGESGQSFVSTDNPLFGRAEEIGRDDGARFSPADAIIAERQANS
ncbi:MAG: hypothetical protein AAB731_01470 [Patescibacteria group bacterium]